MVKPKKKAAAAVMDLRSIALRPNPAAKAPDDLFHRFTVAARHPNISLVSRDAQRSANTLRCAVAANH